MKKYYEVGIILLLMLAGCDRGASSGKEKPGTVMSGETRLNQQGAILIPRTTYPGSSAPVRMQANHPIRPRPVGSLGIEVEPGRIVIDTRKMREALKKLGRQLHAKTMNSPPLHGAKNDGPDLGIRVSDEKVEIDLNKTRNFLKEWIGVMRALSDELDRSLAPQP